MGKVFQRTGGASPSRSVFNLSYEKKFTCDMGKLIPVMCDEVVPGDIFNIANELVIRLQPMVAPMLHEVNAYIHYFFMPYRLLWDDWEEFITGGEDGQSAPTIPTWQPLAAENDIGTLWDYLGFPIDVDPDGAYPIDFPRRAYNYIYNDYYRDENLIPEVALTDVAIKNRAWEKDYFTSALPWQQRGTAPALPISGMTSAVWASGQFQMVAPGSAAGYNTAAGNAAMQVNNANALQNAQDMFNTNTVDLSSATTFDIADLRLAFQIQRWLERNARAGARYTEFLKSHFNISPRDDRLDRPEYIGGSKSPVIVSEVLQTSETATTAQGTLAGHGITADQKFVGKYRVQEFGLIMGIMSVMPRTVYSQGINRQWLRETKYDFFFPEFANLSEQAILRAEIYASDVDSENETIFGYQGRYDEMRVKHSMLAGEMRNSGDFDYWTLARDFGSAPLLNQSFVECVPSKRVFAVQDEDVLIINLANIIRAVRPLPIQSNPGLIDHV